MMTNLCGSPLCSNQAIPSCVFKEIFESSTCINHMVVIVIVWLLILVLALNLLAKILKSRASVRQLVTLSSPLLLAAVVFNCCLGLVYLGLGLSMLGNIFSQDAYVYLPHWWLVTLSQGFILIFTSFAFSIRPQFDGSTFVRFWSVSLTIYAAFICCSSVLDIVTENVITIKACLDVLSLPGAALLLLHGIWCSHAEEGYEGTGNALYKPLNVGSDSEIADSDSKVSPLAKAGFLSKMSFWWLNRLIKMGYEDLEFFFLSPPSRPYPLLQSLSSLQRLPGRTEAVPGGAAARGWLRRGAGVVRLSSRSFFSLVEFGSRSPDLCGRIWCFPAMVFLVVLLRWQELWRMREPELGISVNKATFSLCSSATPVPWRGAGWWRFCSLMKLPRRKMKLGCWAAARFNKRPYACFSAGIFDSLLYLLAGHGGEGEVLCGVVDLGAGGGREFVDTAIWRRLSVTQAWSPTLDAGGQQLQAWTPAVRLGSFNLLRRPSRVLAVACHSHPEPSGFVPGSRVGGCRRTSLFIGAGEEDDELVCVPLLSSGVCNAKMEDFFLILFSCKVLVVICNAPLKF